MYEEKSGNPDPCICIVNQAMCLLFRGLGCKKEKHDPCPHTSIKKVEAQF
jgi:hypothetical protein